jgi:esterase/lipase superfamily enzyme/nucleoid DNA-binding protein
MKLMKETDSVKSISLLNSVATTAKVSKLAARHAVLAVSAVVAESLRKGGEVSLAGIGTFSMKTGGHRVHERRLRVEDLKYPTLKLPSFRVASAVRLGGDLKKRHAKPVFALQVSGSTATTTLHLIRQVAKAAGISEEEAKRALNGVIAVSQQALKSGRAVSFPGVGTLSADVRVGTQKKAPTGVYVRHGGPTGKASKATTAINFDADRSLLDALSSPVSRDNIGDGAPSANEEKKQVVKKNTYKTVQVFFGTDRQYVPSATTVSKRFTSKRGHSVLYGSCEVSIPGTHKKGELESPFVLRRTRENPEKHVVLLKIDLLSGGDFMPSVVSFQKERKFVGERKALVFVHGYNNSFEDAARRTAQIAEDVGFNGVPMFYSWPSKGTATNYFVDGNEAEQAITHLKDFLQMLAVSESFDSIVLMAHSMGNRALTRAFLALKQDLKKKHLKLFKEIILAAPDIDADVFRNEIAPALTSMPAKTTLYASSRDKALSYSKKFNGSPRAGDAGPALVVVPGIETIDASEAQTSLFWRLGHAYIADSYALLADIYQLVEEGLRAAKRFNLEQQNAVGLTPHWKLKR